MAAMEKLSTQTVPERGNRMLHFEHPLRIGEAWCGADVLGVRVVAQSAQVDCVVCADLRALRRGRHDRPIG